jgi:uncharacterized protein (DUF4213/DUF364 family)
VNNGVVADLLGIIESVDQRLTVPTVARVYVPDPQPDPSRNAEFGVVSLMDGSAGLFYAWLGDSQAGLAERYANNSFVAMPAVELARYYAGADDNARSLGLAAISAISQFVIKSANYRLDTNTDSMAQLSFAPGDRVGMIGFFPSLVERLCSRGIAVIVIEKKKHLIRREDLLEVTLDSARLRTCNKILCTGATLINASLDAMLRYCDGAERLAMIGPTASCLPDVLFQRGFDVVGGALVVNLAVLLARQTAGQTFGDSVVKYCIRKEAYPGFQQLLIAAAKNQT